jgi:nucleolar MIF4G domain-containing protein 1
MLEVVTAIRNNNMSKIPNYDPSVGDHLQKILKSFIHKGNYVSTIKIKMEDLLNGKILLNLQSQENIT